MLIKPLSQSTVPKLRATIPRTIHRIASSSTKPDTPAAIKAMVTSFYYDIWNKFDTGPINGLIAPDVIFRGTLESSTTDREGFKHYVREIGASFPDFYQRIDEMFVDGETCIARMHWSGTHTSKFRGVEPTGKKFAYPGVGIFRIRGGLIREVEAIGDTWELWKAVLGLEGMGEEDRSKW